MKRSPLPPRSAPPKKRRAKPRRVAVVRDRAYLDWLSEERACVVCRHRADALFTIDPAHGPVNGRGSKGPDNEAIGLCRHHHIEQHQIGWPAFEAKYGFSREQEAAAHFAAFLLTKDDFPAAGRVK